MNCVLVTLKVNDDNDEIFFTDSSSLHYPSTPPSWRRSEPTLDYHCDDTGHSEVSPYSCEDRAGSQSL